MFSYETNTCVMLMATGLSLYQKSPLDGAIQKGSTADAHRCFQLYCDEMSANVGFGRAMFGVFSGH